MGQPLHPSDVRHLNAVASGAVQAEAGGAFPAQAGGARPFSPLKDRLARRRVTIAGKDGHPFLARPINESDAGALMRCYDAMTERGRWFRMLHHLPHLTEDMARGFCTPDPKRDLCIVLEGNGTLEGEILGGARITGGARAGGRRSKPLERRCVAKSS